MRGKKCIAYPVQYYVGCFRRLNCNKRNGETAPHKAVMLLAVMEQVRLGNITNGFVPLTDKMVAAFEREWNAYVGKSKLFNPAFATPFYHLAYEPFWELMKREKWEQRDEYSLPSLRKNFYGAKIPDELSEYMYDVNTRLQLKRALLEQFFPESEDCEAVSLAADPAIGSAGESAKAVVDFFVA